MAAGTGLASIGVVPAALSTLHHSYALQTFPRRLTATPQPSTSDFVILAPILDPKCPISIACATYISRTKNCLRMGETEGNIVGMIALALALLLNTNLNDPPGVHTLRIIVSGSAGFIFGRPELALHPHEGSTAINPDRLMHAYHGKTDVNLLPGVYDICAFSEAYRPSCVVIKMPDHNAHITVTLTAMPNLTGVPEAEPDSRQ